MVNEENYKQNVICFRCAIKRINKELFRIAKEKYEHLKDSSAELWTIDWGKKAAVQIKKIDEYVIDSNYINYYWIIYDDGNDKKKWSLFYKDYDFKTNNIHIIPGFVQEWVEDKKSAYTKYNDNEKIVQEEKDSLKDKLFGEFNWKPTILLQKDDLMCSGNQFIYRNEECIRCFEDFRYYFCQMVKDLSIQKYSSRGGPRNSIYTYSKVIYWRNCKDDSKKSIFPYTIIYIEGAGFFTQYGKWMVLNDHKEVKRGTIKYELNSDLISFDIDDCVGVRNTINNFFNGE